MAIGVGLVGLGWHGERYAKHLAAGDVPGLTLAAVARRDRARGEARARELGVRFHDSVDALVGDPRVEAVIVVSPAPAHVAHVRAAIGAGKPVLVEKPLTVSPDDAWALVKEARAARARVMVAHTLRWEPVYATAARVAVPEIGEVERIGVTFLRRQLARRASADFLDKSHHRALFAVGVHYLDWAGLLFPQGFVRAIPHRQPNGDDGDLVAGVEVMASDPRRRGRGVRLDLGLQATADREDVHVEGRDGVLSVRREPHALIWWNGRHRAASVCRPIALPPKAPTVAPVLADFRDFLLGVRDNPVPLEAAARAVARVAACARALETHAPVDFTEEEPA